MIKFNKKELNYIYETFSKMLNGVKSTDINDKLYNEYLESLDEDTLNDAKYILKNFAKINFNEGINSKASDTIYWLDSMWVWGDYRFSREEVKEYISDEIWLDIYEKIVGTFED